MNKKKRQREEAQRKKLERESELRKLRDNDNDEGKGDSIKPNTKNAIIDFDDDETFAQKVATVKESYFTKTTKIGTESADFESDDEDDTVEISGSMAQYLSALNKTSKK